MKNSTNVKRRLLPQSIAGLLACACLLGAFVSGNHFKVGLYKWQVSRYIDHWRESDAMPATEESDMVIAALEKALTLRPEDPDLNEKMGTVWELLAAREEDAEREKIALRKSLDYFRHLTQLRPTWPYGWVKIASINLQLYNYDAEFQHAVRNAQHFGPWESYVQFVLLQSGLASWNEIDAATRKAIVTNIEKYYQGSPDEIVAVIADDPRISAICKDKDFPANASALCKQSISMQ